MTNLDNKATKPVFPHITPRGKALPTKENLTVLLQNGGFSIARNTDTKGSFNIFLNGELIGSALALSQVSCNYKSRHFYLHLKSFAVQNGLPAAALDYLPLVINHFTDEVTR
jgi:hypothetical protein